MHNLLLITFASYVITCGALCKLFDSKQIQFINVFLHLVCPPNNLGSYGTCRNDGECATTNFCYFDLQNPSRGECCPRATAADIASGQQGQGFGSTGYTDPQFQRSYQPYNTQSSYNTGNANVLGNVNSYNPNYNQGYTNPIGSYNQQQSTYNQGYTNPISTTSYNYQQYPATQVYGAQQYGTQSSSYYPQNSQQYGTQYSSYPQNTQSYGTPTWYNNVGGNQVYQPTYGVQNWNNLGQNCMFLQILI